MPSGISVLSATSSIAREKIIQRNGLENQNPSSPPSLSSNVARLNSNSNNDNSKPLNSDVTKLVNAAVEPSASLFQIVKHWTEGKAAGSLSLQLRSTPASSFFN
jgi:hypothetical protein